MTRGVVNSVDLRHDCPLERKHAGANLGSPVTRSIRRHTRYN